MRNYEGPSLSDVDEELKEVIAKASSLAKLSEETILNAILSFHAAVVATLTDQEVLKKVKKATEQPDFPERFTRTQLEATVKAFEELNEKMGNPIAEAAAEELRRRLGDTTEEIPEEELSDVATKVLDIIEKFEETSIYKISEELDMPLPDVSNAINELKRAGLVEVGKHSETVRIKKENA